MDSNVISAIVGAIVGATLAWALTYSQFRYSKKKSRIEKSIEMAKEFECILSDLKFDVSGILLRLAKDNDINLDLIDADEQLDFSRQELYDKIKKEKAKKFLGSMEKKSISFLKHLASFRFNRPDVKAIQLEAAIRKFDDNLSLDKNIDNLADRFSADDKSKIAFKLDLMAYINELAIEFDSQVNTVLNKLEWMSMYFNLGVADENVVYQSLHQTMLNTITALYIWISYRNTDPCEKYYDNVITLFNRWHEKRNKKRQEYTKKRKKLDKTGKISSKSIR